MYAVHQVYWKARSRLPINHNGTFFARCFRFVTIHAFDGRTDRQTTLSWLDRVAFNAAP